MLRKRLQYGGWIALGETEVSKTRWKVIAMAQVWQVTNGTRVLAVGMKGVFTTLERLISKEPISVTNWVFSPTMLPRCCLVFCENYDSIFQENMGNFAIR